MDMPAIRPSLPLVILYDLTVLDSIVTLIHGVLEVDVRMLLVIVTHGEEALRFDVDVAFVAFGGHVVVIVWQVDVRGWSLGDVRKAAASLETWQSIRPVPLGAELRGRGVRTS